MRKRAATAGSGVFLVVAPGVVAGLVPWWLTGVAVLAIITGQALILSRPVLLAYAAAVGGAFAAFVHWYEQPTLARRYGAQYEAYRRAVPGWWPSPRPARRTPPH